MSYQPASYYGAPPPPYVAAAPRRRGPLLVAALAGFLVAVIIGGVLVATGVIGGGSSGIGGSSDSVSLPKTVGGYVRFEDATRNQTSRATTVVSERAKVSAATAKALSAAHSGAGAAVRAYTSQDLLTSFYVWAVRAPTPAPVVSVVDPDFLGLAAAPQYVATFGHSSCLINTTPTPKGHTPDPKSTFVGLCQRSSDDLTVTIVVGGGGEGLPNQPDKVASLVDEVWDTIA